MWDFVKTLIDADKLGGWVRAGVAALLALIVAKNASLGAIFSPEVQTAIGGAVALVVVGIWSQIAKNLA